ncbi:MAG: hypothetical protein GVY12_06170 [Bacteroidetes bacterium]|jgi:hypothetical protein|nr:hypothetical protein [Bacteroidota bacterium]
MRTFVIAFIGLLLAYLLAGCGTSEGLGGAQDGYYTATLGTATPRDIAGTAPDVLRRRYNMEIFRVEYEPPTPDVYVQTGWKQSLPAEDDSSRVVAARQRYIVEGRPRIRAPISGAQINVVSFTAEKQAQFKDSSTWVSAPFSPSEMRSVEEIEDYLKGELAVGVRSF